MIGNTILLAMREIRRNVLRSFLTILGIVIGVGAVITMVTIGGGATLQVRQQIASLGSNMLIVTAGKRTGPGQATGATLFKEADAEAIDTEISDIAAVAPVTTSSLKAIFGNQNWTTTAVGTDNRYLRVTSRVIKAGRLFNDGELRAGSAVCLLGETVKKKLFGAQEPLGERIRLQKFSCEVVGLLEGKGQSSMGMDQDDLVVIPLRTLQRRVSGNQDVSMIQISVREGASTDKAKKDIERLMRERRHLGPSDDDNLNSSLIRRHHRHRHCPGRIAMAFGSARGALRLQRRDRPDRFPLLGDGGGDLRLLPGPQGSPAGPDRGVEA